MLKNQLLAIINLSDAKVIFNDLSTQFDRKRIGLIGDNGVGKTTLLNVLSSFIPNDDRIITIENAAELQMRSPGAHVGCSGCVRAEARVPASGTLPKQDVYSCFDAGELVHELTE